MCTIVDMQLFLWHHTWGIITDPMIINQCRRVLRARPWFEFWIQDPVICWSNVRISRSQCRLENRWWESMICSILQTIHHDYIPREWWVLIWLPNKTDKIELIVQKLTELWVERIYFTPMIRSVLKNFSRPQRISTIARESVEQSRRWTIPDIQCISNAQHIISSWTMLDTDQNTPDWLQKRLIVWPEWWFDDREKAQCSHFYHASTPILRTETAAIVAWRLRWNA